MTKMLEVTPAQAIGQLQSGLDLSTKEIAGALRSTNRTVERWGRGDTHPQRDARRRIAEMTDLANHLHATFESTEAVKVWMHASNRHLGGMSPADALRAGRLDRVEAILEALDSGVFV